VPGDQDGDVPKRVPSSFPAASTGWLTIAAKIPTSKAAIAGNTKRWVRPTMRPFFVFRYNIFVSTPQLLVEQFYLK
jgi:hypothetical protein